MVTVKKTIDIKFKFGDRVWVVPFQCWGRVIREANDLIDTEKDYTTVVEIHDFDNIIKEEETPYKFVKRNKSYKLIDIGELEKYEGYKIFKAEKIKFNVNLESYIEEALERAGIDLDEVEIDRTDKRYLKLKVIFDNYLQSIANNFYNVGDEENV